MKAKLSIAKLGGPGGDETFMLSASAILPMTPVLDPGINGVRMLLAATDGTALLDVTVPDGAKLTAKPKAWSYRNKNGFAGITKVALRTSTKVPNRFKIAVKGVRAPLAITASSCAAVRSRLRTAWAEYDLGGQLELLVGPRLGRIHYDERRPGVVKLPADR